ncbi:glycosyltransferase family 4 protein [Anoxybacillus flavithermus]|uniref:Exopolysaccharide biosynthesis glycosyltransferase EpsF n=1 Tax=Anoxybacillus flavithermus TaxID=33934 RepID=A0A178T9Q8_9BACL|nr:glycosyltransferase family 4 protein [Anoxybacillus flavithermus]OAO76721.1 Exopolysaccharide biosynthesis glycosyltransferase EpsF [Anoxybacillus flavithermus]
MKKVRLLYICEAMGGGVRRHLLDIIENIDLGSYDIHLIYGKNRADKIFLNSLPSLKQKGIYLYELKELDREISLKKDSKALIKIIKIINSINPDIVHCHSSKAGALGRAAAYLCGVKNIIYTPHAYMAQSPNLSHKKMKFYVGLEKLFSKITKVTINVSEGERQFALQNGIVTTNNSTVIYNGISIKDKYKKIRKNNRIIIGTVARLSEQKDPITFYNIAKNIVSKYDSVDFRYVGDGPFYEILKNKIEKDNLQKRIQLVGFKNNISDELAEFDIFITTSLYEGMPYALIEALSEGLPIVGTNVTGNNEIIFENINGYLFNIKDVNGAVQILEFLINNPEKIKSLGEQSYKIYIEKFTIEKMIEKLEKTYEQFRRR